MLNLPVLEPTSISLLFLLCEANYGIEPIAIAFYVQISNQN